MVTRLLCVPTLIKGENAATTGETSVMVASRGRDRGGCGNRGGGREGRGVLIVEKKIILKISVMAYMIGLIRQQMSLHLEGQGLWIF